MTNEEAINILEQIDILSFRDTTQTFFMQDVIYAIDTAIDALKAQPMHGYKIDFFTLGASSWLSSFNTESATCCFTAVQELKKRLEVKMKNIKRELTKEEYEKGKINPYYLISDDIKMGYGAYGAEVYEEDGKYYLTFSMGDSCD